jgi:hypothetical protein
MVSASTPFVAHQAVGRGQNFAGAEGRHHLFFRSAGAVIDFSVKKMTPTSIKKHAGFCQEKLANRAARGQNNV